MSYEQKIWLSVEHPGYSGKKKDEQVARWNQEYGETSWRLAWELADGSVLDYPTVFWQVYVAGYTQHFLRNRMEAIYLTHHYSYAYDKDLISKAEAFDPFALYNKPGVANQFHNVALNIALEHFLGLPFKGNKPVQVREGKPGTPTNEQPEGYLWSPGRISAVRPELIPNTPIENQWWFDGSVEDLYQRAKVLQICPQSLIFPL